MRIAVAGRSLAAILIVVPISNAHAAPVNPELPSVRAAKKVAVVKTTAATTKTAVAAKPKPARPTLVATINLSTQRMSVASNGRPLYTWRISSGRRGFETPTGRFRPGWMAKQWYSRKYDMAPMPYSVFFNGGIATHGTTAVSRLGRPASHGCIRLQTANARRFYNLVRRHGMKRTRIIVTGRTKKSRYVARSRPRRTPVRYARRRSAGVVRHSARSFNRTPVYRPRRQGYRAPRRLIYPGDRY